MSPPVTSLHNSMSSSTIDSPLSRLPSLENLPNFNSDKWAKLFGESSFQYPFDDEDERLIVESAASDLLTQQTVDHINGVAAAMDTTHVVQQLPAPPPPTTTFPITPFPDQASTSSPPIPLSPPVPMLSTRETMIMTTPKVDSTDTRRHIDPMSPATLFPSPPPLQTPRPPTPAPTPSPPSLSTPIPQTREHSPALSPQVQPASAPHGPAPAPPPPVRVPHPTQPPRRSSRQPTAPTRLGYDGQQGQGYVIEPGARWLFPECGLLPPPLALKATPSDPDTLSYDAAMADTPANVEKWMEAARKEISSLEKNGTWIEVDVSKAKSRILPGTWVFRCKQTPDGEIRKFKARSFVRGDLEEGEPETFDPVVAWSLVRLFLILSLTLNWKTCSINFSTALVQAKLQDPVWIHLPRGFQFGIVTASRRCVQLVKSLYGLSVATRLWFEHILA